MQRALTVSIIAALALTGCGGGDAGGAAPVSTVPVPVATPSPSPSPSPSPGPSPSPSPSPSQTPVAAIWQPDIADTWQWQLSGTINTGYAATIYDIDLVDTPQATIDALHARGRRVICYFSAGSAEDFRADFGRFDARDMGNRLDGWPGERWLDIRSATVRAVMRDRLTLAAAKTCDGVEPDNVDGYTNRSGFALTAADQLDYNRFLAKEAHARGLAVGLKNDVDQVPDLVDSFDYAVNEQCHEFDECDTLRPFIQRRKPVFNAEYKDRFANNTNGARDDLCRAARSAGIRTLVLPVELNDRFRYSCD